jgi:hypothetical protein
VATGGSERPSQAKAWHGIEWTEEALLPEEVGTTRSKQEEARRSGGSVATGLLLVLTADCKARNAPRFASPSASDANGSHCAFQ